MRVHRSRGEKWASGGVWAAGLAVALGAGVATAHGLYEVAKAAKVAGEVAWLYPLITDGLALVAYAATTRLAEAGRRYAWSVVVLAAGLSGVAQATYLAGGVDEAPTLLRFGVGAWPAVAAAVVAHLLFLLGTRHGRTPSVQPDCSTTEAVPVAPPPVQAPAVQPAAVFEPPLPYDPPPAPAVREPAERQGGAPARERARAAASDHVQRHGGLPTVTELMNAARVSRGTAGSVLKELREQRPHLHVVNASPEQRTHQ